LTKIIIVFVSTAFSTTFYTQTTAVGFRLCWPSREFLSTMVIVSHYVICSYDLPYCWFQLSVGWVGHWYNQLPTSLVDGDDKRIAFNVAYSPKTARTRNIERTVTL